MSQSLSELFFKLLEEKQNILEQTLICQATEIFDPKNFPAYIASLELGCRKLETLFNQSNDKKEKLGFSVLIKELLKSRVALKEKKDLKEVTIAIINSFALNLAFNDLNFIDIKPSENSEFL